MKFLKRILFVLAALITLTALFYAVENWRGTREYQSVKATLLEKGAVLDFAELIPARVSASENFGSAPFLQDLKRQGDPDSAQAILENIFASVSEVMEAESPEQFLNIARRIVGERGAPEETLPLLAKKLEPWLTFRQALVERLSLPHAHWNQAFVNGNPVQSYPLLEISIMPLMNLAAVQARIHLLQGEGGKALEDVLIGLRLGEMYRLEPGWICHVVFLADLALTNTPIDEGLRQHIWNRSQLDQLDHELSKIDFRSIFQRAMRGERAFALSIGDTFTRDSRPLQVLGHDLPTWKHLAPRGWALRGLGVVAEAFEESIQQFERTDHALGEQIDAWAAFWKERKTAPPTAWTAADLVMAQQGIGQVCLESARQLAVHRAVIQLAKFQLEKGHYPTTLNELPSMPLDPLDDQPLIYERVGDGFRVEATDQHDSFRFQLP